MTDVELAEIKAFFKRGRMGGFTTSGSKDAIEKAGRLIAEVRRLRAENEGLEREFATYAEIKTDRNLELSERIQNLQSRIKKLQKQRDEFEKDIRI